MQARWRLDRLLTARRHAFPFAASSITCSALDAPSGTVSLSDLSNPSGQRTSGRRLRALSTTLLWATVRSQRCLGLYHVSATGPGPQLIEYSSFIRTKTPIRQNSTRIQENRTCCETKCPRNPRSLNGRHSTNLDNASPMKSITCETKYPRLHPPRPARTPPSGPPARGSPAHAFRPRGSKSPPKSAGFAAPRDTP